MKVLLINSVCGFGSTGKICTDIYKLLEEEEHECCIAYGRNNAPEGYKTIKIGSKIDNYLHVAKSRLTDRHGFGSKQATLKFIEKIKEYNPDIIHLHNIHGYYLNVEVLFKYLRECNKKIVWTLHDCWSYTGHCAYYTYADCDKWKTHCTECSCLGEYPKARVDKSYQNFDEKKKIFTEIENLTIVTPSSWLKNDVKQSFLKEYPAQVIKNGIDINIFKSTDSNIRNKFNLEDKKVILGVASVWDKRKGLETFIKLSKELDSSTKIVLIGLSKQQIESIPKEIIGIERTQNIFELVEWYNTADVFVNPTLEDNYPTTNLEAIACGTPVITNDSGGSAETIDESTGIVVKGYKELVDAIEIVLSKKREFDFSDVSGKVDKNIYLKKYVELYKNILETTN